MCVPTTKMVQIPVGLDGGENGIMVIKVIIRGVDQTLGHFVADVLVVDVRRQFQIPDLRHPS